MRSRTSKSNIQGNIAKNISTYGSIFLLLFSTSGCLFSNRTEIVKQTGSFSESLAEGSTVLKEYFLGLNTVDINAHKLVLSTNPDCDLKDEYDVRDCRLYSIYAKVRGGIYISPFKEQYIRTEAINARLELLNVLSIYAATLSALAKDDSPNSLKASFGDVQAALISVSNRLKKGSSGESLLGIETSGSSYIKPLTELAGIVGSIYLNEKRWEAIRDAVSAASPNVDKILGQLEQDLFIAEKKYVNNASLLSEVLRKYYRDNKGKISLAERQMVLDAYQSYTQQYQLLTRDTNKPGEAATTRASDVIKPIREANTKLSQLTSSSNYELVAEISALIKTYEIEISELRTIMKSFNLFSRN
jgi:hypothetical protein